MKLPIMSLILILIAFSSITFAQTTPAPAEPQRLTAETHGTSVAKLSGTGDQTTKAFQLKAGPATFGVTLNWERMDTSISGQEGKFSVTLVDQNQQYVELVIGTIDHFDGARTVQIPSDGSYMLKVIAPGPWSVNIEQ